MLSPEPGQLPAAGEGAGAAEDPTEELPVGVQKRFGQLLAQIRSLEQRLSDRDATQSQPQRVPMPAGLDQVFDLDTLTARQSEIEEVIQDADNRLSQLRYAPGEVEAYLRKCGVRLTDAQGQEDYSVEKMGAVLDTVRKGHSQVLRHIPRRRDELQAQTANRAQLVKVFPFLNDRTDPSYAAVQAIFTKFPMIRNLPNPEWAALCHIEGDRQLRAKIAAREARRHPRGAAAVNGNGGARASAPNSGAGGASPPRSPNTRTKLNSAREEVLRTGSKSALSTFFETAGFVK